MSETTNSLIRHVQEERPRLRLKPVNAVPEVQRLPAEKCSA
jgi:hypothetical protein